MRALIRRGKKADAQRELKRLEPAARRMGYGLEVRPTYRRQGRYVIAVAPYGVYLVVGAQ